MGNREQLVQAANQYFQQPQGPTEQQSQQTGLLNQVPPNLMPAQGGYATTPDFQQQLGILGGGGSITGDQQTAGNIFGANPEILRLQNELTRSKQGTPFGNILQQIANK